MDYPQQEKSSIAYLARLSYLYQNAMPSNVSSKKIKRFRRIATRYDKTARLYLTGILFVTYIIIRSATFSAWKIVSESKYFLT